MNVGTGQSFNSNICNFALKQTGLRFLELNRNNNNKCKQETVLTKSEFYLGLVILV